MDPIVLILVVVEDGLREDISLYGSIMKNVS